MHRFLNIQQNIKLRNYHQLLLYFVAVPLAATAAGGRRRGRRGEEVEGRDGERALYVGGKSGSSSSSAAVAAAAEVTITIPITIT